jgi:hypothetical protein
MQKEVGDAGNLNGAFGSFSDDVSHAGLVLHIGLGDLLAQQDLADFPVGKLV